MGKNIVICCDGTGNGFSTSTHVARFADVCHESIHQVVYYSSGIGASRQDWFRKYLEMALGIGLTYRLRKAYKFLIDNYNHGDDIYLIGFSRGAYTVRSLAALIQTVGILDRSKFKKNTDNKEDNDGDNEDHDDLNNKITKAIYLYQERNEHPSDDGTTAFRRLYSHNTDDHSDRRIRFLGVWDTVGSLGFWGIAPTVSWVKLAALGYLGWLIFKKLEVPPVLPETFNNFLGSHLQEIITFLVTLIAPLIIWSWKKREDERFHNCKLGRYVDYAYHIMAKDEQRLAYRPQFLIPREGNDFSEDEEDWGTEKWREERKWNPQTLMQCHIKDSIEGSHSDIGGGYARNQIGYTTFTDMLAQAKAQGIIVYPQKEAMILDRFKNSERKYKQSQDCPLQSQTYSSTNNSTTMLWFLSSLLINREVYEFFWRAWDGFCKGMRNIFNPYPRYELDISSEKPLFKGSGLISSVITLSSPIVHIIWWGLAPIWWSFAYISYWFVRCVVKEESASLNPSENKEGNSADNDVCNMSNEEIPNKDNNNFYESLSKLVIPTIFTGLLTIFIGLLIYCSKDILETLPWLKDTNPNIIILSIFGIILFVCSFLPKKLRIIADAIITLILVLCLAVCLAGIIIKSSQDTTIEQTVQKPEYRDTDAP